MPQRFVNRGFRGSIDGKFFSQFVRNPVGRAFYEGFRDTAERSLRDVVEEVIELMRNHPASQELEQGLSAGGSQFLDGNRNLFAFLGFEQGRKPISEFAAFLRREIRISDFRLNTSSDEISTYTLVIYFPTHERINEEFALDRGVVGISNIGWPVMLELGTASPSNLEYFLPKPPEGRSTGGIQLDSQKRIVRAGLQQRAASDYLSGLQARIDSSMQEKFTGGGFISRLKNFIGTRLSNRGLVNVVFTGG